MDRLTKLLALGWACAALGVAAWLAAGWQGLPLWTAGTFALAAVSVTIQPRAVAVVLALTYVFPAVIWIVHGTYHVAYDVLWLAALLGAVFPQAVRTSWHVPARWRTTLACWALIVAAGATVVAFREVDFNWRLLTDERMPTEAWGAVPRFTVDWVIHTALLLVIGILWFDWLFGARAIDAGRWILAPLAAGALPMLGVALYQLAADVRFLNPTVYASLGRATGTLFDANVFGAIAAVWIGGAVLLADQVAPVRWRSAIIGTGLLGGWLAVWASGSRTGFAAAVIITAFTVVALRASRRRAQAASWRPALVSLVIGTAAVAILTFADLQVIGPVVRVWETLPSPSAASVRAFVVEAWNRNGYGSAATAMIREYPWFGVGVGCLHVLLGSFVNGQPIPPDNAQNWYRHQLAELGLVGSLPWILWVVVFASFVLARRPDGPPVGWAVRGMLIGIAVISMVGMPTQATPAAITFWTVAFWFVSVAQSSLPDQSRPRSRAWMLAALVLVAYVSGTVSFAVGPLRPPVRALRGGSAYSYGFYGPEPDSAGGEQRWAMGRAAIVLDVTARTLALTVRVNHVDVSTNPVSVAVWLDGDPVIETTLQTTDPVTRIVHVPDTARRVLLETWASRTLRPRDYGVADDRRLGLLVKWSFVDE